jgi:hypothetical protein
MNPIFKFLIPYFKKHVLVSGSAVHGKLVNRRNGTLGDFILASLLIHKFANLPVYRFKKLDIIFYRFMIWLL